MERERNGSAAFDVAKDGIRKAALLLSVLDAEAADALLARFEPEVARAIEAEAEAVGNVPAEDVDAIVAEFLTLSETAETPQTSQTPQTPQTPKTAETREATNGTASEFDDALFDGRGDFDGAFQTLDAVEPERLARALSGARPTTVAVALSRLSARRRAAVVSLLPEEKRAAAFAALPALVRTTDAARRLEDALFNGALNDE